MQQRQEVPWSLDWAQLSGRPYILVRWKIKNTINLIKYFIAQETVYCESSSVFTSVLKFSTIQQNVKATDWKEKKMIDNSKIYATGAVFYWDLTIPRKTWRLQFMVNAGNLTLSVIF